MHRPRRPETSRLGYEFTPHYFGRQPKFMPRHATSSTLDIFGKKMVPGTTLGSRYADDF